VTVSDPETGILVAPSDPFGVRKKWGSSPTALTSLSCNRNHAEYASLLTRTVADHCTS
jgi:hypothetical protein